MSDSHGNYVKPKLEGFHMLHDESSQTHETEEYFIRIESNIHGPIAEIDASKFHLIYQDRDDGWHVVNRTPIMTCLGILTW